MASSAVLEAGREEPQIKPDLNEVVLGIHDQFDEQLDPLAVDECLCRVAARFDDAKVRSFVPLLVRRYVNDELQERVQDA